MPVGGAILGSAVIGGIVSSSAADKAASTSQQNTDAEIAAENARYQQIRTDEAPFVQGGYTAENALLTRLGLAPPPSAGAGGGSPNALNGNFGYRITLPGSAPPPSAPPSTAFPGTRGPTVTRQDAAAAGAPLPVQQAQGGVEYAPNVPSGPLGAEVSVPAQPVLGTQTNVDYLPGRGPGVAGGGAAPANALSSSGSGAGGVTYTTPPPPPPPGSPGAAPPQQTIDYAAFLQANPDIAAWASQGHGDPSLPPGSQTPEQAAAYWISQHQQLGDEPRALAANLPMTSAPTSSGGVGSPTGGGNDPVTAAGADPGTFGNAGNPTYQAPGESPLPSAYVNPEQQPTYQAPAPFSYTEADYRASPAFQFQLDQAMKGTEAGASLTGALRSGATAKALQDRAENMALGDFQNERAAAQGIYDDNRNFGYNAYQGDLGQFNTNRGFNYGAYTDTANRDLAAFNTDRAFNQGAYQDARNYLTGRYDTQTGNLFNLTTTGQNAASATGTAGLTTTNGIVNALATNSANQGNAAIAGANSINSLLGSGVNAFAYYQGRGGVQQVPPVTPGELPPF